jgi:hypothetical protein
MVECSAKKYRADSKKGSPEWQQLGYPAHWLSDILSNILNNQLHTTARFPRTSPLTIAESKEKHSRIRVDAAPLLPEFSSLAAIRLAELPFGVASSLRITRLSDSKQYTIRFKEVPDLEKNHGSMIPCLNLLFAQPDAREAAMNQMTRTRDFTFRRALMDDDHGYHNAAFVALRQKSLLITTWTWDRDARTASFWLDNLLMKKMLTERPVWTVNILRMDTWNDAAITDVLNLLISEGKS